MADELPLTEKDYSTGGLALHFAEGPSAGAPLVLLHGESARWQNFERILPALAERWHVYALDLRGHGRSGRASSYRLLDYAEDVIAFLRGVVGEPAFLFGHALGGMVALMAAAKCPDLVRGVIAGDAPLDREMFRAQVDQARTRLSAWRALAGGQLPLEQVIEALKESPVERPGQEKPVRMRDVWPEDHPIFAGLGENLYYNDPAMLAALLDDYDAFAADYQMHTLLPTITCPVLLLQADPRSGGILTDVEVARAKQLLQRPEHVRLAGVSHALYNANPQAVLDAVNAFLEQQTSQAS